MLPENGQLALNPPLTPNRVGGCSTRTVHPLSLALLNRIIHRVDGEVTIHNPLWEQTKAQVCHGALTAVDPTDVRGRSAMAATLSCSKASSSQRSGGRHCGWCWACLVRRAALDAALDPGDPTRYSYDPWDAEVSPTRLLDVVNRGRLDLWTMLDRRIPAAAPYRRLLPLRNLPDSPITHS